MFLQALRQVAALLGLALLPAFVSGAIQLQPNRANLAEVISPAEVLASTVPIVWIDSRPQAVFDHGHATQALLLNSEDWDRLIPPVLDAWHPDKLLVVYGAEFSTSETVARRLRKEMQIKNVRALKGGWERWQAK